MENSRFLQNIGTLLPDYTVSHSSDIFTAATVRVSNITTEHRDEILNRFK